MKRLFDFHFHFRISLLNYSHITLITMFYLITLLTPFRYSQTRLIHKDYLSLYPIPQNILSHSSEFYTSPKLLSRQYIK